MHLVLIIKTNRVLFRTSDGRTGGEPHKHDLVEVQNAIDKIKLAVGEYQSEETLWDL